MISMSLLKFRPRSLQRLCGLALAAALVAGCDPQNISELQPGESSEADVRAKFGAPEAVWEGEGGVRIFEYNRQPAGHRNYMISIGPDGKMQRIRQVLDEGNFARVTPGMPMEDVRRMLGKPAKVTPFELKGEIHYDWRYLSGPNASDSKLFTVVFDRQLMVMRTERNPDPELQPN
ncbi:outer membrane protein assembly factor BamE [Hydrogenophaga sp. 5NK40-0174]|uniref:outer membrane protein assembly factor BamE domain-containing protein n=1 Tax=Hydrogenophaga sp. 5NK40-0174 TaxID=3127649 RepID=UPI0033421212